MSGWRKVVLGDVLTLKRGFDLPAAERTAGPFPVVSSSGVTGSHTEFRVRPPGVVIGRYGSLGSVHWVEKPFWPLNTSLWVKDFKDNDPRFVSYLLKTVTVDGSTASAVPGVNRNHLHGRAVRLPSRGTQRRIAAVLSAFDQLIKINERRIELLEDLARSLYREWFVHFRFPGHEDVEFLDSELGPIPEGWEVHALRDLVRPHRRSVNPATEPHSEFEHFSIPAFDLFGLPKYERGETIKSAKQAVDGECVLLSKINPRIKRVWFAKPSTQRAVASTEFLMWAGVEVSNAWLWATVADDAFYRWLLGAAGGTSTSHQRVKPQDVAAHLLPLAPPDLRAFFDRFAFPALRQATLLRQRCRALAATRDLLLPRLVTGCLDISDVDLGDLLPAGAQ